MSTLERRSFIATVSTIPLSAVMPTSTSAENLPQLEECDPLARALEYVCPTNISEQPCGSCQLFHQGSGAEWGTCGIFPDKKVNARGWCKSWIAATV